jgi:hypothetical protein
MIFDHRIYTIRPGKIAQHVDTYGKYGYDAQTAILGKPVLYATAESGELNTIVHIWAYESAADREEKRVRLAKDPGWIEYRKQSAQNGFLVQQQNRILVPAPFCDYKR